MKHNSQPFKWRHFEGEIILHSERAVHALRWLSAVFATQPNRLQDPDEVVPVLVTLLKRKL